MEDRVDATAAPRPGLALAAFAGILVITAAWWALALWPLSPAAPSWIVTTRAVCFGSNGASLPDAGGWLVLIGEPLGMFGALAIVWGRELQADFARLRSRPFGRAAAAAVGIACLVGVGAAWNRVAAVRGGGRGEAFDTKTPLPARGTTPAPALLLRDQHGRDVSLQDYRGRWAVLTFAFGHCTAICPLVVHDVLRARLDENAHDVPLVVVTLDPWRDTPDRLTTIARQWGLGANDVMLSGSVEDVNATLDAWGIARSRDPANGDVTHPGVIVVIDPAGREAWRIDGATHRIRDALAQSRASAN